jgi:hypothetical protein
MSAEGIPGLPSPAQVNGNGANGRSVLAPGRHRSTRTVAELCEDFADVCASAVDPLEIASALEFEGIGDRTSRARYDVQDVFALARDMYERVPRRPAEPEPAADPWQVSKLRPVLHGFLYALPAVLFPAAGTLLVGPGVLTTLVVALLIGWGLSQGLACIGYLRLGTLGEAEARRVLRAGLAAGLLIVVLSMTLTWRFMYPLHPHGLVVFFGVGEGAYMLGACVLMVLGAERWLPVALAPGVLGSAAFLILDRPPGLEHMAWATMAATPVLACAIAMICTRTTGPRTGHLLVAHELRAAGPAVAFGLVAAGLLVFPIVAGPNGYGGVNTGALLASLPLSFSVGLAEWSVLWYRRRTRRLLRTIRDPRPFAWLARLALLLATLQYLAAAVTLTALAVVIADVTGLVHPSLAIMPQLCAYLALGTAMFISLLLQALRASAVPTAAAAVTLAAEIVLRHHGAAIQLAAPLVLLAVVAGYAAVALSQPVRHGF